MILKALRLSMTMIFKLRFTTHILISLLPLTLATASFAFSHMAYQQPSYGDNPNLMRVLLYKTKQKLIAPRQAADQPILVEQVNLSEDVPIITEESAVLEQHIVIAKYKI